MRFSNPNSYFGQIKTINDLVSDSHSYSFQQTEFLFFNNIFNHSINLIAADIFDVGSLRLLLEEQELTEQEIGHLLDHNMVARWGNRCADPYKPPKGFDRGTRAGQLCKEQNCIDGCPNARWFRDSRQVVKQLLAQYRAKMDEMPLTTVAASTLQSKIKRLQSILRALERKS